MVTDQDIELADAFRWAVGRRILVTGGSGFIGTNLIHCLQKVGSEVINLDCAAPRDRGDLSCWIEADILNVSVLEETFESFQPEYLYHLAARTDFDGDSLIAYNANVEGVKNIISAVRRSSSIRRTIFASSRLVCETNYLPKDEFDYCPPNFYGESKVFGEKAIRASDLERTKWLIVRPTSIWGPWFEIPYRIFFDKVAKGQYFHPRGLRIEKSYGFVGNTIYQLGKLMGVNSDLINGQTLYLGDYPPLEVFDWAKQIRSEMEAPTVKEVPYVLLAIAARIGDLVTLAGYKNFPLTSSRLENLITPMVYDLRALNSICGDLPYALTEGVALTVEWMRKSSALPRL